MVGKVVATVVDMRSCTGISNTEGGHFIDCVLRYGY